RCRRNDVGLVVFAGFDFRVLGPIRRGRRRLSHRGWQIAARRYDKRRPFRQVDVWVVGAFLEAERLHELRPGGGIRIVVGGSRRGRIEADDKTDESNADSGAPKRGAHARPAIDPAAPTMILRHTLTPRGAGTAHPRKSSPEELPKPLAIFFIRDQGAFAAPLPEANRREGPPRPLR